MYNELDVTSVQIVAVALSHGLDGVDQRSVDQPHTYHRGTSRS